VEWVADGAVGCCKEYRSGFCADLRKENGDPEAAA